MPLPGQIHPLQKPLGAVRTLPKISRHILALRSSPLLLLAAPPEQSRLSESNEMLKVLVDGVGWSVHFVGCLVLKVGLQLAAHLAADKALGELVDEVPAGVDADTRQVLDFNEDAFD